MSYARFVSHHPVWVLIIVGCLSVVCLVISILNGNYIDFSDPKAGFKTRGTEISGKVRSLRRFLDVTGRDEHETFIPYQLQTPSKHYSNKAGRDESGRSNKVGRGHSGRSNGSASYSRQVQWEESASSQYFYSEYPSEGTNMARLVYRHRAGRDLFTYPALRSICRMENRLLFNNARFKQVCLKHSSSSCSPSWSLPNFVALLNNRSSCHNITREDVNTTLHLLKTCHGFYYNYSLHYDCHGRCKNVPEPCKQHNAIYIILHYITDYKFLRTKRHLEYTMSILPASTGQDMIPIYQRLIEKQLYNRFVQITALNFGIKYMLFDHYLRLDAVWITAAVIAIFLSIWLYTSSIFVTFMTLIAVGISLDVAYFLYTVVYGIHFFPFMNLLTLIIAIGIGADDVFVFCKLWHVAKSERNNGTLDKIVSNSLKHATLSMFVTSFTTAAAFFTNYISDIIAIRCFSVYAGTVVLTNFILMISWIPATLVIQEKWCSCCVFYSPDIYVHKPNLCYRLCKILHSTHKHLLDTARIFFEKILPWFVIKLRYFWLLVVWILTVGGATVIFYHPKLRLPSSNEFKVFNEGNLMEVYDTKMRDNFIFEKAVGLSLPMMPLTFIWGIIPIDDGGNLSPESQTKLKFDKSFNMATAEAQTFLSTFCSKLRNLEYSAQPSLQVSNCFIDTFRHLFMERECQSNGQNLEPCCNKHTFPYPDNIFKFCVRKFGPEINRLPFSHPIAGPRYSKQNREIVGLIVEFSSNQTFTYSYDEMNKFYSVMNAWTKEEMKSAPEGMNHGWFTSEMEFYDLQNSIATGTPVAIGLSIGVSALVLFLTTLNIVISVFAMLSIISTITITIASLVLLGWELAILESTTISIAVGLSIDFTLHYGVAYRISPDLDREMRVVTSLQKMGSAVALAAFTTFMAGALMLPSTVLAYQHIGTFLMIVMFSSWFCSTFYFQSLLRILGPVGGFGQFHWPRSQCCTTSKRKRVDKTIYSVTESTLSTSSANHVTELHELEPLTNHRGYRRRLSRDRCSSTSTDRRYSRSNHPNCVHTSSVSTVETTDEQILNHRTDHGSLMGTPQRRPDPSNVEPDVHKSPHKSHQEPVKSPEIIDPAEDSADPVPVNSSCNVLDSSIHSANPNPKDATLNQCPE